MESPPIEYKLQPTVETLVLNGSGTMLPCGQRIMLFAQMVSIVRFCSPIMVAKITHYNAPIAGSNLEAKVDGKG